MFRVWLYFLVKVIGSCCGAVLFVLTCRHFFECTNRNLRRHLKCSIGITWLMMVCYITLLSRERDVLVHPTFSVFRITRNIADLVRKVIVMLFDWIVSGTCKGIYQPYVNTGFMQEGVLNIIMFVPLGVLVSKRRCPKHEDRSRSVILIIIASILSTVIEVLQEKYMLGSFDLDDIIHNTIGAVLGYRLYNDVDKVIRFRMGDNDHDN